MLLRVAWRSPSWTGWCWRAGAAGSRVPRRSARQQRPQQGQLFIGRGGGRRRPLPYPGPTAGRPRPHSALARTAATRCNSLEDDDAPGGGCLQVDVVHAGARPAHDAQVGGGGDDFGGHLGVGSHDQSVVFLQRIENNSVSPRVKHTMQRQTQDRLHYQRGAASSLKPGLSSEAQAYRNLLEQLLLGHLVLARDGDAILLEQLHAQGIHLVADEHAAEGNGHVGSVERKKTSKIGISSRSQVVTGLPPTPTEDVKCDTTRCVW
ncbi:hypothetical protein FOCC_FOCC006864 [Frankliniella occidentalis]|nr:hypothetical protein FOCC_FOCC006864 [Frankliniella occidentalis]